MNRIAALERLAAEGFDLLIVGGGATGLGCAVDAAARGYRTALVEGNDFAAATSSRSTKLVHGGVRYLAQGDVHLVREALRERSRLLANAPAIVHDRTFITPAYHAYEVPYYFAGLKLYDALAGRGDPFGRSRLLSANASLARIPWLRRGGLHGGIEYHDGQFDDTRLAVALARTAVDRGAALANYCRVLSMTAKDAQGYRSALVRDEESGNTFEVRAKAVVNAAGIFVDDVRRLEDPGVQPLLAHSRGTHIVVSHDTLRGDTALLIPKTDDGRVVFAIPWHEHVLIGTTDVPADCAQLDPVPTGEEIEYLLSTLNRYTQTPVGREHITATFAGLRPLVARAAQATTAKLSREHLVDVSPQGLVTIAGGKWTTYRAMAEDAVDVAIASARLTPAPCITQHLRLHDDTSDELQALIRQRPSLAEPLCVGFGYTKADAVNAFRNEMARSADDVLERRTRLAFLDAKAARSARATVEELRSLQE